MKIRRTQAGWALKLWVLGSVFLIPFVNAYVLVAWALFGGVLGFIWRALPEEPETPPERLPFHDRYADREIPRPPQPAAPPEEPPEK